MKSPIVVIALSFSLAANPLRLLAEDAPAPISTPGSSADNASAEESWRKELRDARRSQSRAKTTGVVTTVVGLGLLLAGNVRAQSSDDVDGCSRSGSDITCNSQAAADESNQRLDQGRAIMVGGLVAGLTGLAFLVSGSRKNNKIEEIEGEGRQNGYQLSLAPVGTDGLEMRLSRNF